MELISKILNKQVLKFAIAGAVCACIEFISFNILIDGFYIEYLSANVISILIAITTNYILSRTFVFERSRYSRKREVISFIFFSAFALMLNQFILWFLLELASLDVRWCKAIAIALVSIFNYLTKKHIVFKN